MPYEVLCSFVIPRRDTYFYTVWANGTELDGEHFNLIITHEVTTYDQPTFLAGLSIIIADLLCLPLVLLFMRKQRQGPGE